MRQTCFVSRMSIREEIEEVLRANDVVVFMNGTRKVPECSDSAFMVDLLNAHLREYVTIDVKADPKVTQAVQEYSSDTTIPQLYVRRKLIGGTSAVLEMNENGDLARLFGNTGGHNPRINLAPEALAALKKMADKPDALVVRLLIGPDFRHDLDFDKRRTGDIPLTIGEVTWLLDRSSFARADGVTIEYEERNDGAGFRIFNPNDPRRFKSLGPKQLKSWIDEGKRFELLDVRPEEERAIAVIPGSRTFDDASERLAKIDPETPLVVYCHNGVRSRLAAQHCLRLGFRNVYNLDGGIDLWASTVDPTMKRYGL